MNKYFTPLPSDQAVELVAKQFAMEKALQKVLPGLLRDTANGAYSAVYNDDGWFVYELLESFDSVFELFIVSGGKWSKGKNTFFADNLPQIELLALAHGCSSISFITHRKGWNRLLGKEWHRSQTAGSTFPDLFTKKITSSFKDLVIP
jgi:hypothetical protein